jgi:hypothetical protein
LRKKFRNFQKMLTSANVRAKSVDGVFLDGRRGR